MHNSKLPHVLLQLVSEVLWTSLPQAHPSQNSYTDTMIDQDLWSLIRLMQKCRIGVLNCPDDMKLDQQQLDINRILSHWIIF